MKKNLITFASLILSYQIIAQIPDQGVATYKKTINIHASLPKSQAVMKAFIPEFSYSEIKVSFKDNLMRFDIKPLLDERKKENVKFISQDSKNIIFYRQNMQLTQYGTVVDIDYFFTQDFAKKSKPKLLDESKIINGYKCQKAIDEKNNFVIWYQPDNNHAIFPTQTFAHIPGLVVKVEGKKMSYELQSIKPAAVAEDIFNIPQNHKKISYEQFQDLQEEFIEKRMSILGKGAKIIKSKSN